MKANRYLLRFFKCCIYLTMWVLLILVLMKAFGQTEMSLSDLFTTENGMWLWVFVLIFSLVHPIYGYCRRQLNADAMAELDAIDGIARRGGYARSASETHCVKYRAVSVFKKIMLQFEDEITIEEDNGESYICGPRKEVVKMAFRFDTYLMSKENNEKH